MVTFRHAVMFRWRGDTTGEQKQEVRERAAYLPYACPTVRALDFGDDLGLDPGNYDAAFVFDFEDRDGFLAYDDDAAHRRAQQMNAARAQSDVTARIEWYCGAPPSRRGRVRHLGLYRWADGTDSGQRSDLLEYLSGLEADGLGARYLEIASGIRTIATDFDWLVEAHFEDPGAAAEFLAGPAYAAVRSRIDPLVAASARLQHRMLSG